MEYIAHSLLQMAPLAHGHIMTFHLGKIAFNSIRSAPLYALRPPTSTYTPAPTSLHAPPLLPLPFADYSLLLMFVMLYVVLRWYHTLPFTIIL